ncbi:MAG: hypothetical protein WBB82_06120 [Limnothrix sp.]
MEITLSEDLFIRLTQLAERQQQSVENLLTERLLTVLDDELDQLPTTELKTQQKIIGEGYQVLLKSLGVVDTIRFIQYLSIGQGNYTLERTQWLEEVTLDEMLQDIENLPKNDNQQYEEIID